eukprot:scaffold3484_cov184-Amphora_coffeaeformis.AAC.4
MQKVYNKQESMEPLKELTAVLLAAFNGTLGIPWWLRAIGVTILLKVLEVIENQNQQIGNQSQQSLQVIENQNQQNGTIVKAFKCTINRQALECAYTSPTESEEEVIISQAQIDAMVDEILAGFPDARATPPPLAAGLCNVTALQDAFAELDHTSTEPAASPLWYCLSPFNE